jgi:membrane-bound lytic murein transglycosylase A
MPSSDILKATAFDKVVGWNKDNHERALAAFKRSYLEMKKTAHGFKRSAEFGGTLQDWLSIPEAALNTTDARHFFEINFVPFNVIDLARAEGLFTGYYEPEAEGSLKKTEIYQVPDPPNLLRSKKGKKTQLVLLMEKWKMAAPKHSSRDSKWKAAR